MKAVLAAALVLALVAFVPAPAAAQQAAQLTVYLQPAEEPLREGESLVIRGIVTFTADWTAMLGLTGTPVTYAVEKHPEWASVVVSPASDVFPVPCCPSPSPAYSVSREITVTITLAHELTEDASGAIEISATSSAAQLGKSATGKGTTLVAYDAPEEPCPEHALTQEQLALYAAQASDALSEHEAARQQEEEDVTVQSTGAATRATPWVALGAFALVGAAVGLALRRRLGR